MILTNVETVPGKRIIEHYGLVSGSTVRNHIYNIYQKLGVGSRLELVNRIGKDARNKH